VIFIAKLSAEHNQDLFTVISARFYKDRGAVVSR